MTTPTVIKKSTRHRGKVLAWGENAQPTLAEFVAAIEKEFPGADHSRIVLNNFILVTEGPMYGKWSRKRQRVRVVEGGARG